MEELPEAAKTLGMRYLVGDINDIQLNFLCCQKNFDKESIVRYAEDVKATAKSFVTWIILGLIFLPFAIVGLLYYLN